MEAVLVDFAATDHRYWPSQSTVLHRYCDVVARRTSLFRVIKRKLCADGLADILSRENRLRSWWRYRLDDLRATGLLDFLKPDLTVAFARNCPPVGVATPGVRPPCKRPVVCPYCRARQAADVYDRLAARLFNEEDKNSSVAYLCRFTVAYEFPYRRSGFGAALHQAGMNLDQFVPLDFVNEVKPEAAAYYFNFDVTRTAITLTHSVVFTADDVTAARAATRRYKRTFGCDLWYSGEGLTRGKLAEYVVDSFAYPAGMFRLARTDAIKYKDVCNLIKLFVGRRLLRTYGACRLVQNH